MNRRRRRLGVECQGYCVRAARLSQAEAEMGCEQSRRDHMEYLTFFNVTQPKRRKVLLSYA